MDSCIPISSIPCSVKLTSKQAVRDQGSLLAFFAVDLGATVVKEVQKHILY